MTWIKKIFVIADRLVEGGESGNGPLDFYLGLILSEAQKVTNNGLVRTGTRTAGPLTSGGV